MDEAERCGASWPGAVAVSGGGDSLALMLLLAAWAHEHGRHPPLVLTVDHGLRKGSLKDAREVVRRAQSADLKAHVLRWRGAKPASGIEAKAREVRYALLGAWCRKQGIANLFLGHTLEDQAETFLLRLARGSGIDGLSAMNVVSPLPVSGFDDIKLIRPLLGFRRTALRSFLAACGETWLEDPMNMDAKFARVRLRNAWPALEQVGLTPGRIGSAARHLARARVALERDAQQLMEAICRFDGASAHLDSESLLKAPAEIGLRVLANTLMRVSGEAYRPRFERLEHLYLLIRNGQVGGGRTLHGCRVAPAKKTATLFGSGTLSIFREEPRRQTRAGMRKNCRESGRS